MRPPLAFRLPALALLAACASAPPPLALPAVTPTAAYERLAAALPEGGSPQTLHIELLAVRDALEAPAAEALARMIASDTAPPFRGRSALPPGTCWLAGSAAAAWQATRKQQTADQLQSLGATDAVLAVGLRTIVAPGFATAPAIALERQQQSAGAATAVDLRSLAADGAREDLHIAAPLPDEGAVLFVPARLPGSAGFAVVLMPGATAAPAAVQAAFAASAEAPGPAPTWPAPWRDAFAAVGEQQRRPALLALARDFGSERSLDLLLDADERGLIDITQALREIELARSDVAWQFERASWRALLPRLERDELPTALRAALRRHLGAMASDASALALALQLAADATVFAAAVHEENVAALADADAATRAQAHDWLSARGRAVPGFDPLAPAAQRRRALRAYAANEPTAEAGR